MTKYLMIIAAIALGACSKDTERMKPRANPVLRSTSKPVVYEDVFVKEYTVNGASEAFALYQQSRVLAEEHFKTDNLFFKEKTVKIDDHKYIYTVTWRKR